MTRSAFRSFAIATAFAAFTASTAWAIPSPFGPGTFCGGLNFKTCASLDIQWSGTTATIQIANVSTKGDVFTSFGFTHLPAGTTVGASSIDAALGTRFAQGDANDIQAVGFNATNPAPQTGLVAGEGPFTFTITFGGTFTTNDIANLDFSIHSQAGPNQCSTKLIIAPDGTPNDLGEFPNPACGTTVVPEPITMTLLASGLAGMGGVGALRRRRKV